MNLFVRAGMWLRSRRRLIDAVDYYADRHGRILDMVGAASSIAELRRWIDDTEELQILPCSDAHEGRVRHWVAKVMAYHFQRALDDIPAPNFLTLTFQNNITVTILRPDGKTPEQVLQQRWAEAVGQSEPWPLLSVLDKLVTAADILLHRFDYDGHGWEEIERCRLRAVELRRRIADLLAGGTAIFD